MGGEGHGMEAATTKPQVGGNRLGAHNMFHAGAEAAIVLLLPTVRFIVYEDLHVRTLCLARSLNRYLSTKPSQSHLQFNYTQTSISHTSPPLHTHLVAAPRFFIGFRCCPRKLFPYRIGILFDTTACPPSVLPYSCSL